MLRQSLKSPVADPRRRLLEAAAIEPTARAEDIPIGGLRRPRLYRALSSGQRRHQLTAYRMPRSSSCNLRTNAEIQGCRSRFRRSTTTSTSPSPRCVAILAVERLKA